MAWRWTEQFMDFAVRELSRALWRVGSFCEGLGKGQHAAATFSGGSPAFSADSCMPGVTKTSGSGWRKAMIRVG